MDTISFLLNGERVEIDEVDPNTTLLQFLRDNGWTGTKEGCAEGECGACAVAIREPDGDESRLVAINACLILLASVADREVWTVEGVAADELHPVQQLMAEGGGSQCGYCTPGFIMSLYAEFYRKGRTSSDEESIAGNLCRCTGYRPIRDALHSLPVIDANHDRQAQQLRQPAPAAAPREYIAQNRVFARPTSLNELWPFMEKYPHAKLVAGGTDVVVEMNQVHRRHEVMIGLDAIEELRGSSDSEQWLTFGAGLPLADIEHSFGGLATALDQLWPLFSSRLIRRRATLGGNLVNASPIGDSPPVLLALDAEVEIRSATSARWVAVSEFFTGYRKTVLAEGEILSAVRLPKPMPTFSRFYKVSKRVADDISTVAAGFAVNRDPAGVVTKARLAFGGVAATPLRLPDVEGILVGRTLSDALPEARAAAEAAVTPLDDHRGSARYRRAMVGSLIAKMVHEATS